MLISLIGCGFHLRGTLIIPKELKTIRIMPNTPNEDLQRKLRTNLKKNGVKIVSAETKKVTTLTLSKPVFSEEVIAIGANNQPQRIRLIINFNYHLHDKTGELIKGPITITSFRDFSIDPLNLLSSNSERNIIKNELYTSALSKLMRSVTKVIK